VTVSAKHVVALLAISLIVFAVVVVGGTPGGLLRAVANANKIEAADVRAQLRVIWILAGVAMVVQLVLAGSASALAPPAPTTFVRSLALAGAGFLRAVVPCLIALAAIVLGCVALVVPGLVLVGLLAFTGASAAAHPGATPSESLAASVATARANWRDAAVVVAAIVAADVAVAFVVQLVLVHAGAPKLQLDQARDATRVAVLAFAIASPIAGYALAAVYKRNAPS
jgi:hypothetical protein